ncbi:MAG TPA: hypothetical protein DIW27_10235 [Cytophagales bacterium]|nr:hypothetical protein [Cytophagales bacterium]
MENVAAMVEEFFRLPRKVQDRRIALRDLLRTGTTQVSAAKALNVSVSTIEGDMRWLRMMAAKYIFSPQFRSHQQKRRMDAKRYRRSE